jgi:hypothetical protein
VLLWLVADHPSRSFWDESGWDYDSLTPENFELARAAAIREAFEQMQGVPVTEFLQGAPAFHPGGLRSLLWGLRENTYGIHVTEPRLPEFGRAWDGMIEDVWFRRGPDHDPFRAPRQFIENTISSGRIDLLARSMVGILEQRVNLAGLTGMEVLESNIR